MGTTLERLVVRFDADFAAMDKAFGKAERRVTRSGQKIARVGAMLTAGVTLPLLAVGAAAVSAASDAEEAGSKFDVVMGSAAGRARERIDELHDSIPAARAELIGMAASIQDLVKPLGLSTEAAADMSLQTLALAGDLSSFNNVPMAEALLAIRSGFVGQSEPLLRFGADVRVAAIKAKALELGLMELGGELTNAARVQAVYAIVQESNTDAMGDAARTADSTANSIKFLVRDFKDLGETLGDILVPVIRPLVQGLSGLLVGFGAMPPVVQRTVVVFGALAAGLGPLLLAGGALIAMLPAMATGLAMVTAAGIPLLTLLGGAAGIAAVLGIVGVGFLTMASNADAATESVGSLRRELDLMHAASLRARSIAAGDPFQGRDRTPIGRPLAPTHIQRFGITPRRLGVGDLFGRDPGPARKFAPFSRGGPGRDEGSSVERTMEALASGIRPLTDAAGDSADRLDVVSTVARGLAPALGGFGSFVSSALGGLASGGALGLGASVAGAVVSGIASIFGGQSGPTVAERLAANTEALKENTDILRAAGGVGGRDLSGFVQALERFGAGGGATLGPLNFGARLAASLRELGLEYQDFLDLQDELGLHMVRGAEGLEQFLDVLRDLEGQSNRLRRSFGLLDVSSGGQLAALQAQLAGRLEGPLAGEIAGLDFRGSAPNEFLARLLESVRLGTFDLSQLGDLSLTQFLDDLAELESLGDAAGNAADALNDVAGVINAPSGFKVALRRFQATDALSTNLGGDAIAGGVTFGGKGSTTVTVGTINVQGGATEEDGRRAFRGFKRALELDAARGGADEVTLGVVEV